MASNERNIGEKLYENLRQKKCIHCGSGNIRPFFAIEQGVRQPYEYWHTIFVVCTDCKKGQLERTYYDAKDWDDILNQTEWFIYDENSMRNLEEFVENKNVQKPFDNGFYACPEPLSPKCHCSVHWILIESVKKLESLTDTEMKEAKGVGCIKILFSKEKVPMFVRTVLELG